MMEFGTIRSIITTYHDSQEVRAVKHYKIRIKVRNPQEEMTEFIRFTSEMAELRSTGVLTVDKDDPTTKPAFILEYPHSDVDGSYFIIKSYCVIV